MTFDELEELHYITSIGNMDSILNLGILSHRGARTIQHQSVAMREIQERRQGVVVPGLRGNRPLHEYANLYFHARNPMLYQIVHRSTDMHKEICIVKISKEILNRVGVIVSDKNASSEYVRFYNVRDGLRMLDTGFIFAQYWNHDDPIEKYIRTSIKCAEVLVPDIVPIDYILGAYVSCDESRLKLYNKIGNIRQDFEISINPDLFFCDR